MVVSKLNSSVQFIESREIDEEDRGHESDVYELDLLNKTIAAVLGKPRYTFSEKNVVYMPIYAVRDKEVVSKVGVFELPLNQLIRIYKNGSIDPLQLKEPLLFEAFQMPDVIEHLGSDIAYFYKKPEVVVEEKKEDSGSISLNEDERDFEVFGRKEPTLAKTSKMLEPGIFTMDATFKIPESLKEENEADAIKIRKEEFRASNQNTWIENRMYNNHYRIEENEGSGDCFFAVVRDAYKQIGRNTTVEKLRGILAKEMTETVFLEYRSIYTMYEERIKELNYEIDKLKKKNEHLRKEAEQMGDKGSISKLVEEANIYASEYKHKKQERTQAQQDQVHYAGHMANITTIDQMREYILTSNYWADTWAITTVERVLNMKMIILSETEYEAGNKHGVIQCGELSKELESKGEFNPEYYIMTSYSDNHYRLITYKRKGILKFFEIPFDMKMMIINRCLEKSAGVFYLIQDFRNLKTRMGIEADEGRPVNYSITSGAHDLYDPDIVFVFHGKAAKAPKPGMADGEKIPSQKRIDFWDLGRMSDWRKMLDDTWSNAVLTIEGHKWTSVAHYLEGCKYKKGFPDVYLNFSLDSGNDAALDLKNAKKALRAGVKMDVDYELGRQVKERELALESKFIENMDMRHILVSSSPALLLHKEGVGKESVPDMQLMQLRKSLLSNQV